MDSLQLEWLMGAGFIAIYAYRRYNTPVSNRSSTTFFRFSAYYLMYLSCLLALYAFVGSVLRTSPELLSYFYQFALGVPGQVEIPDNIKGLTGPMVTALALTTLLPNLPLLARFDKKLLISFWDLGHIPGKVIRQGEHLRRSLFNISSAMKKDIRALAKSHQIDSTLLEFEDKNSINHEWTRLAALQQLLLPWTTPDNPRYYRFTQSQQHTFDELQVNFLALTKRTANYFSELTQLSVPRENTQSLLNEIERHLRNDNRALTKQYTEFIARGIFACELTAKSRHEVLLNMGFDDGAVVDEGLTANQFITLMGSLIVAFCTLSVVETYRIGQTFNWGSIWFNTLIMTTCYGMAALCGLFPKGFWCPQEYRKTRPLNIYLLSAAMATAVSLIATITLRYINTALQFEGPVDLERLARSIMWSYPYLLQSFVIALATAWITDNHNHITGITPRRERLIDTASLAATMAIGSFITFAWLEGLGPFEGTRDTDYRLYPHAGWITACFWFVVKGGVVGAVVGYLVPFWFHRNRSKTPLQQLYRYIRFNRDKITRENHNLNEGELLNAIMITASQISTADQHIRQVEKDILRLFLYQLETLHIADFTMDDAMQKFDNLCELHQQQPDQFNQQAINYLAPLQGRGGLSELMVHLGNAIALGDHDLKDSEQDAINWLAQQLNTTA